MLISQIAKLRCAEAKGLWFLRSNIDLIVFPQPLLKDSPFDLLETLKLARAESG